jgi:hypothetical protein
MSAYKYGSRGVIPAKFKATCEGDPIDTQGEDNAHPMKLKLTKLGSTPDQDAVVESPVTGSANTGDLFRFVDEDDHYNYNAGVKNLARGPTSSPSARQTEVAATTNGSPSSSCKLITDQ